jgi:hypothetical protein
VRRSYELAMRDVETNSDKAPDRCPSERMGGCKGEPKWALQPQERVEWAPRVLSVRQWRPARHPCRSWLP